MTRDDFILKAAEWFLYDLHEQSLKLLAEADDNARHISGVCYKHYVQDLSAKQLLTEIHDLALEFSIVYNQGTKAGMISQLTVK